MITRNFHLRQGPDPGPRRPEPPPPLLRRLLARVTRALRLRPDHEPRSGSDHEPDPP